MGFHRAKSSRRTVGDRLPRLLGKHAGDWMCGSRARAAVPEPSRTEDLSPAHIFSGAFTVRIRYRQLARPAVC